MTSPPSSHPEQAPRGLERLVTERSIIVCAGSGGVGKTTTSAALAVLGARLGRRTAVVTIDPARRLAGALGLETLGNDPHPIEGPWGPGGELWAMMLDAKSTFDEVVGRYAGSAEQAQAIYQNRLYRNISGVLSGTQEYMALEKLYELHEDERFDLIVVDTPPTRHALDFLNAPQRLVRFLDNRIFRLLMTPTRVGLRALNVAAHLLIRTISRVAGGEVVNDTIDFFSAFEGMERGFRARAGRVLDLLTDPATAFVVVAAPRPDAVADAVYFAGRLGDSTAGVDGLVVNRLYPRFNPVSFHDDAGEEQRSSRQGEGDGEAPAPAALRDLLLNLEELNRVAAGEQRYVEQLRRELPGVPVALVPYFPDEVNDLDGLGMLADYLASPPSNPDPGRPWSSRG